MTFLVDQNLSTRLCTHLDDAGHEAVHVEELSLSMAEDVEILDRARTDASVIISSDTDFSLALDGSATVEDASALYDVCDGVQLRSTGRTVFVDVDCDATSLEAAFDRPSPRSSRSCQTPG